MAKILKNQTVISLREDKRPKGIPTYHQWDVQIGTTTLEKLLSTYAKKRKKKKKANIHAPGDIYRIFIEVKIVQI